MFLISYSYQIKLWVFFLFFRPMFIFLYLIVVFRFNLVPMSPAVIF